MKLTYMPAEGEKTEVTVFGITFVAGVAQDVSDDHIAAKLKENPTFGARRGPGRPPREIDPESKARAKVYAKAQAEAMEAEAADDERGR